MFLACSLYFGNIPTLAPNKPLTPELADEVHRSGAVTATFLPPSILDAMSKVPEFLEGLQKMRFAIYSSAPLALPVVEKIKPVTRLVNLYSQSELGMLHWILPDDEDPVHFRVSKLSGIEFQHYEDDLYECVMIRNEPNLKLQGAFLWQPNATEQRTNDLFTRHPDPAKSDYWLYRGRLDDIIVFETGEKANPVNMEELIETHPNVLSAMVIGAGRVQAAVLIEPRGVVLENESQKRSLVDKLWPTIERANEQIPSHGRLVKELVLFTKPNVPILKTPKGTVRRQATYKDYVADFDAAYKAADELLGDDSAPLDLTAPDAVVEEQLRQIILEITKIDAVVNDDDLFSLGMDSLQVLQITRRLRSALRDNFAAVKRVTPSLIYANPSVQQLCSAIMSPSTSKLSRGQTMENLISKLSLNLPRPAQNQLESKTFVLTGTTGGLGSYLLGALMQDPSVKHVYCLNRSTDAGLRQATINRARGLPSTFDAAHVTFLHIDLTKPNLGLAHQDYLQLLRTTTHIIHNAWTVDWKLSLDSFVPQNLNGIKHLIDLTSATTRKAQLHFVSSLGTVINWNAIGSDPVVPEEVINNPEAAEPMGYAESKYVAERVLAAARLGSGIHTSVLRVGQIAGPVQSTQGQWTPHEWMPRLVKSSLHLGLLPKDLGAMSKIDWIPVDILAQVILEVVAAAPSDQDMPVRNIINPAVTTWQDLYPSVQRSFKKAGVEVEAVDLQDWVRALRKSVSTTSSAEDVAKNPGVHLIDFYESLVSVAPAPDFSTQKTQQDSRALRECGPMKPEWMELYMQQWGYLPTVTVNGVNGIK